MQRATFWQYETIESLPLAVTQHSKSLRITRNVFHLVTMMRKSLSLLPP